MSKLTLVFAAAGTLLAVAPAALADTVNFNPGATQVTTGLTGFATTGSMMDGMKVLTIFNDGSSELALWADDGGVGPDAGRAAGTNWALSQNGDTFSGLWTYSNNTNKGVRRVVIDAGAGDSVFDIAWGNTGVDEGTPGSALGATFARSSGPAALVVTATYGGIVATTGNDPVGDLWRFLDIHFSNDNGLTAGSSMSYRQDTDNLLFRGDLGVPLPTAAGMGLSVLGLAGLRRRR